jgi:hypothetical protein
MNNKVDTIVEALSIAALQKKYPVTGVQYLDASGIDVGWVRDTPTSSFHAPSTIVTHTMKKTDWKMRIPPQKYANLKQLTATDSVVWAFMDILDDPTLTDVDLQSPYLSAALDYLIATYPNYVTTTDKLAWLAP